MRISKSIKSLQHVFILVEGPSDEVILSNIIPRLLGDEYNCHFYVANGFSGILSSVKPIMDLTEDAKIVIVYDSDSQMDERIREKLDFVKYHLDYESNKNRLGIFYFVPAIDVLVPGGWELARIKRVSRAEYNNGINKSIVENFAEISQNEVIVNIIDFIKK